MYEIMAEAGGREAAQVIYKMADVQAGELTVAPCDPRLSTEETLLRVVFQAEYEDSSRHFGSILLGGPAAQANLLAAKIAGLMGLMSYTPPDANQVLSELLNIAAGQIVARWQEYGYQATFNPPDILTGQEPGSPTQNTFEVNLHLPEFPGLRLWLIFPEREFRNTVGC